MSARETRASKTSDNNEVVTYGGDSQSKPPARTPSESRISKAKKGRRSPGQEGIDSEDAGGTTVSTVLGTLDRLETKLGSVFQTQRAIFNESAALVSKIQSENELESTCTEDLDETGTSPERGCTCTKTSADTLQSFVHFVADVIGFASSEDSNMPQPGGRPMPQPASGPAAGCAKKQLHDFFDMLKDAVEEAVLSELKIRFTSWQMSCLNAVQEFVSKREQLVGNSSHDHHEGTEKVGAVDVEKISQPMPATLAASVDGTSIEVAEEIHLSTTPPMATVLTAESAQPMQAFTRPNTTPEGPFVTGRPGASSPRAPTMVELISSPRRVGGFSNPGSLCSSPGRQVSRTPLESAELLSSPGRLASTASSHSAEVPFSNVPILRMQRPVNHVPEGPLVSGSESCRGSLESARKSPLRNQVPVQPYTTRDIRQQQAPQAGVEASNNQSAQVRSGAPPHFFEQKPADISTPVVQWFDGDSLAGSICVEALKD